MVAETKPVAISGTLNVASKKVMTLSWEMNVLDILFYRVEGM